MIELSSAPVPMPSAGWATNTAIATLTAERRWAIANGASSVWLTTYTLPVIAGQQWHVWLQASTPTGPNVNLSSRLQFYDAADTQVGAGPWVAATANEGGVGIAFPDQYVPAGATTMRIVVTIGVDSGTARVVNITANDSHLIASVDEIVASALGRPAATRAAEVSGSGALILTRSPAGPRSGSLTMLCAGSDQVAAVDAIYQAGPVLAPKTGPLPAITHYAVGQVRGTLERALPGRPARWLVSIDFREAA